MTKFEAIRWTLGTQKALMKCLFLLFTLYKSNEEGICHSKAEKITPGAQGFWRGEHNVLPKKKKKSTDFIEKVGKY